MFLKDEPKNVFEATIQSGEIRGRQIGRVAMASSESQKFFTKMKNELWTAKIADYEISAGERTRDVVVSAKVRVTFNGKDLSQKIIVSRIGAYKPEDPREPIDIGKDSGTKKFCLHIAEEARKLTGEATWAYSKNGNPIPHEDIVLRQVREILKDDIKNANIRLVKEMKALLDTDEVQLAARVAFEDVMRDRVHNALQEFEKLPPETMHKFLDEMYCKKIHDS